MPQAFRVTLVTPEAQILDEQVTHASIPAWDGRIGVLHLRAPLLAKLGYGPLKLDLAAGGSKSFFIGGGFAQVKNDVLTILTDEATPAEDVNAEEATASLKEAQARRAISEPEVDRRERDLSRARALVAMSHSK